MNWRTSTVFIDMEHTQVVVVIFGGEGDEDDAAIDELEVSVVIIVLRLEHMQEGNGAPKF